MIHSENLDRRASEVEQRDDAYHIFVNNVDSFNGKYILSSLYKQGFEEVALSNKHKVVEVESSPKTAEVHPDETEEIYEVGDAQEEKTSSFDQIISITSGDPGNYSKYKILGSLSSPSRQKPEELFEVTAENNEQFKNIIIGCDCVIYDISADESQIAKALTALSIIEQDIEGHKCSSSKHSSYPIIFILISTCMTWAFTPSMDPTDQDPIPFLESDYRRRKPHPNYKKHYDCEREVLLRGRKFKGKLRTMIVCSGVTYGFEESLLTFFFKRAWNNDHYLPIFGSGTNFVPLIHIADLAQVICKLVSRAPLKNQYILAVEQTPTCLKNIVKFISRTLGNGKIEYVVAEEAYLYSEIDQHTVDCLTANIVMEPEYLITSLGITWRSEMNLIENIEEIAKEFKLHRNLEPLKIFIHGPPCSGKTKLACLICAHYNLHYISIRSILDHSEAKMVNFPLHQSHSDSKLRSWLKEVDKFNIDTQGMEEFLDTGDIEDCFNLDIQDSEEENYKKNVAAENRKCFYKSSSENSRLTDEQLALLLRKEIFRNQCQNLGFVLDGYPKTFKQAEWLFRNENYRCSVNSDEKNEFKYDRRLIPTYSIHLDASDSFLLDRISRKPEESMRNTHYNERDMIRRLMTYRNTNTGPSSPMSYFDDCDTEIVEINVSEFPTEELECILHICKKIIGAPRGFGLTRAEIIELAVADEYQEKLLHEKEELQKQLLMKREKLDCDEEMKKLLQKYNQENIRLDRIVGPKHDKYRIFIAKNILPVVYQALVSLTEKKPKNPLDFLAEYLFENNPNGKMYDSRYSRNGEKLTIFH